ncbi:uncharacterized protein C8orf76 homolog isoform X1 [Mobula birostris]|uniref:uncharacterized protein C8orf76 homolog isoform X1 n=2 Tax=Mobula birostris TaxID=1983395 RepID=UPI003B287550
MVDVGCEFEDSVFEEFRVKKAVQKSESGSYKARFCEPEWFWDDVSTMDEVKKLTALKFRGDLAFKRQDYQKALCEYASSLALVPDSNIALRRDLQEARARCLSYLGRDEDALDIAQELRSEVTNTDHLTTVLNLNIKIYHNAGNLMQELCCLQQLISLHPLNPWYWKKLAEAYHGLAQGLSSPTAPPVPDCKGGHCLRTSQQSAREAESSKTGPDCARLQGESKRSPMSETCERQLVCPASVSTEEHSVLMLTRSRKPLEPVNGSSSCSIIAANMESKIGGELQRLWLFAYSSFVRARLLLQMMKPQQTSFVLERSQAVQEEISQQLSRLYQSEELLNVLTKTMGKDLLSEKIKNGADAEGCAAFPNSSALSNVNIETGSDFEERWFKKTHYISLPW